MSAAASENLQQHLTRFGLSSFRPGQQEVIDAVLAGRDCMSIMPTGGGKSLCYQLPAIAREGVTLVVSPLIALMKDQVDSLQSLGLRATFINSSLSLPEQRTRMDTMAAGGYDLVYIAPERLRNSIFMEAIRKTRIQLLAVDEAHCISEWGHDFRPDYARLGRFRQRLGFPQTIALTATATPDVRDDVVQLLLLQDPQVFISGFARTNLEFSVCHPSSSVEKDAFLLDFLRENPGAGIVYASTRKKCAEVVELIADNLKRNVGLYHGGMLPDDRRRMQDEFMAGRIDIIAATNAFGMGIDKANLRFVVHYNMPGTLEAYYQEAGRAGRDGLNSRCMLLFSHQDRYIQEFFIENAYPSQDAVQAVYEYLCREDEDPIEVTLEDLKERLELPIGTEGVGSCLRLLEKCGALERMDSHENKASVRIDSELPTLVDLLPKTAKVRRKVLQQIEKDVGELRYERVYFHVPRIAAMAEMDKDAVLRALRDLNRLSAFDYVAAFRGRAIHMLDRQRRFDDLDIDFDELQQHRQAEYEKLDRVIAFAKTRRCRQLEILRYFGDPNQEVCGKCDNCGRGKPATGDSSARDSAAYGPAVLKAVRMVLSGVARSQGRYGKRIIAQMLSGSKASKISKFGLDQLSTFGLLKRMKQADIEVLIEAMIPPRLLEPVDVERNRPVLKLTELGGEVMRGKSGLPDDFRLDPAVTAVLTGVPAHDMGREPADDHLPTIDSALHKSLRDWRRDKAEASGDPPYKILTNAAIESIARQKPRTKTQLGDLKGIGPVTLRRFGKQILQIVASHSGEATIRNAPSPKEISKAAAKTPVAAPADSRLPHTPSPEPPPVTAQVTAQESPDASEVARAFEKREVKPDYYWTWRLLNDGYPARQCEQIRRIQPAALIDHVLQAAEADLPVRLEWLLTASQVSRLEEIVGDASPQRLLRVRDQLPADLELRHVQLYLRTRANFSSQ